MATPKKRREADAEELGEGQPSNDPAAGSDAEEDPVTERPRTVPPLPEEGVRGDHSADDPVTRERVAETGQ